MSSTEPPPLNHIKTLTCPTGKTRAWQSHPHPSPTAPLLATASSDRSVAIWSLRDFTLLSTITGGHKRSVRTVQWKDFGNATSSKPRPPTLATGSFDANVGIWVRNDDRTNGQDDELEMDVGADDAGEDWHFSSLLTGPDSEIKSVAFSPAHYGTNLLATSSRDKSVWIWEEVDVEDEDNEWETIAVLGDHTGDVKCVAWCAGYQKKTENGQEPQLIGHREILASGSYDDTIRLWRDVEAEGDWICVGVIDGHKGTVWDLSWEGYLNYSLLQSIQPDLTAQSIEEEWEPRIVSCSDDLTVRIWRRQLSEAEREKRRNGVTSNSGPRLPSTIRPPSALETWVEDAILPEAHVRSVYAVDWSPHTGLIVSCGGDGAIVVYKEISANAKPDADNDVTMNGTEEANKTKWSVIALLEAAHDEFEVNHVCWATRRDSGKRYDGEEIIVSTGDDGDVRIWELPNDVGRS